MTENTKLFESFLHRIRLTWSADSRK